MTALNLLSFGLAAYGAGLSTYIALGKRRRRVIVSGDWGTDRLGHLRNHLFFIVRVVNTGERAVTISEIEWHAEGMSFAMHVFRHSKGKDLPMKIEPDEEGRVLFDFGYAANALAPSKSGVHTIKVSESSGKQTWTIPVTTSMREEAEELVQEAREQAGTDDE